LEKKSRFNIRRKVLLILYAVLSLTLIANFVISAEIVESFQVKAFNNEAFATARGLQTNLNSLIEKSFLPYTDIVNCEPLLDDFVESNEQVLYTYTTDAEGTVLYTSSHAVSNGLSSGILGNCVLQAKEECIDDEINGILYYILPLHEKIESEDSEKFSTVGVLVVAYPRTCITDPLSRLYMNNAVLAGVTFVLSFLLIFLSLTKWVTKPLQMLDEAIRKVSRKGFEGNRLDIRTNDEIGQITQSFNEMLEKLAMTTVSKEYVDSILFNMSEALFVIDTDKRIEKVNDAALQLLGYQQEEVQGQPLDLLYSKVFENAQDKGNMLQIIEEDISRNNEIEFVCKKGDCIWVSVNWSVIKDEEGNVSRYVCTARDITELKKAQSIVMYQANYDQLTGLANRYNLENSIERILNDTDGNNIFMVIDLDKFKMVNDLCGHMAGDELLKQIACMLQDAVGEGNLVARLGGDEFAIIMYHTDRAKMTKVMETLLKQIESFHFIWEGRAMNIGMSIGAFEIDKPGLDRLQIFSAADNACYIAKMSGGNRLHIYTDADGEADEEVSMISILMDAFENDGFFLDFQPIASATKITDIHSYEALLRIRTKDGVILEPGTFLSTAERYHKLLEMDQWVVHNICKTYHEEMMKLYGGQTVQIAIPITGESLISEQFLEFVAQEMAVYKIPKGVICLEVIENAVISNYVEAVRLMKDFKELGCRIAIAHFGVGISSYMYLRNMPVDIIKIDGTLIRNVAETTMDEVVVKSINEIVHLLDMKTVAETVDNETILQKVQELGIDFVQGNVVEED